jgi:hypothetical protein
MAQSEAIGGGAARRALSPIDDAAVAELDAAAVARGFDDALLRMTPARDIRARIETVVGLLEKMDPAALLKKQGPISRLVGADVEARLQFELASEKVIAAVRQLKIAAQNGTRMRMMLDESVREIEADQSRFEAAIVTGRARLTQNGGSDQFTLARYERRLANITAMHAANILAIEQLKLAKVVLTSLLDRFTDVETLLLPVWQRHVLALASAAGATRQAGKDFSDTNDKLIDFLRQDLSS